MKPALQISGKWLRPRSVLRGAALALIFCAALLGSAAAFTLVRPFAGVPVVREKVAHLIAHRDEYDTLFIGTSRVYRGIMPSVFDAATAQAGLPTRSFNFGIDAMFPPEDAYVLEWLIPRHLRRLRWVVIESSMLHKEFEGHDPESARFVHWHDWRRTRLICTAILSPKGRPVRWRKLFSGARSERERLALVRVHARLFAMRTFNLGRGEMLFAPWRARPPKDAREVRGALGPETDGFAPMPTSMDAAARVEYDRQLAERTAHPARRTELMPEAQRSLDAMLARIRKAGARPIVIISPTLGEQRLYPRASSEVPVLDYTSLEKSGAFFDLRFRADHAHLSPEGAQLYTRAIAADFLEVVRRFPDSR